MFFSIFYSILNDSWVIAGYTILQWPCNGKGVPKGKSRPHWIGLILIKLYLFLKNDQFVSNNIHKQEHQSSSLHITKSLIFSSP